MSNPLGFSFYKRTFLNRSILVSPLLVGVVFISGSNQDLHAKEKSIIAIEPLVCDVVKAISPPSRKITCLINRSENVHNFRMSPKQAQMLSNASQIITLGPEMTPAMKKWVGNPITLLIGASAIKIEKNAHNKENGHHQDHGNMNSAGINGQNHDHHSHGGLDPHIWHNPQNIIKMGKLISEGVKKTISVFDRSNRKILEKKSESFESILLGLEHWTKQQISTIPTSQRTIVSKHNGMKYYGDAFGLKTVSLLDFLGHSSSLRPKTISSVLSKLKEENIKVIFPEQKPSSKLMRNISKQSSIPLSSKPIYVDGLMPTGNTISVAIHNTCTIVNSLGGLCEKDTAKSLEDQWRLLTLP